MEFCVFKGLKPVCKGKGVKGLYYLFEQILYSYDDFIEDCIIEYGEDCVNEMSEEELTQLRYDIYETEAIDVLAKLSNQGFVVYKDYLIKLD